MISQCVLAVVAWLVVVAAAVGGGCCGGGVCIALLVVVTVGWLVPSCSVHAAEGVAVVLLLARLGWVCCWD